MEAEPGNPVAGMVLDEIASMTSQIEAAER
jgi:hypothetical protein